MTQVFNLPHDRFPGSDELQDEVLLFEYTPEMRPFKGKSILHTNVVSLVVSGEKTMAFAEKTVYIKKGTFHFISAGKCIASVNLIKDEPFRSVLLFFSNKALSDFYIKYYDRIEPIKKQQHLSIEPYLSLQKDEFIDHYISSLALLLKTKGRVSADLKLLKFEELMLYLLEKYPKEILSFQSLQRKELDDIEIQKVVELNLTNQVTVEELAFLCNMSLSTFKRRFTKIFGSSPNKWMLHKRMEMAKDLLLHGNEKPGDIYYKVGYENHSSFSKSFKQTYGVTPTEFQTQKMNVYQ